MQDGWNRPTTTTKASGGVERRQEGWSRLTTTTTKAAGADARHGQLRQQQQQHEPLCSVIDYSKWDHFGDTEEEDEDDDDDGQVEEAEEAMDYGWSDDDDEGASYWYAEPGGEGVEDDDEEEAGKDTDYEENQEEAGKEEKGAAEEEAEAELHEVVDENALPEEHTSVVEHGLPDVHEVDEGDLRKTESGLPAERTGVGDEVSPGAVQGLTALTDDGETNKLVLLQVLQQALADSKADPANEKESIASDQLDQLREQYARQLAKLQEMVGSMRDEQFDRAGTCQVLRVFDGWQADFQSQLRELHPAG